ADLRHPRRGQFRGGVLHEHLGHQGPDHLQVGDGEVASADLLHQHSGRQPVQSAASVGRWHFRCDEPGLPHLDPDSRFDAALLLPPPVAGGQLLFGELPGRVTTALLVGCEVEIHGTPRSDGQLSACLAKSGLRFSAKAAAPSLASSVSPNTSSADIARLLRPAWWSVSALNDCLRNRIAVGLISAICAAHRVASGSSWSAGTTSLTRPHRCAVSASYCRHRYQISRARFSPTTRARNAEPNPASTDPTRRPACPR